MYQIIKVSSHFGASEKGTHRGPNRIISALARECPHLTDNVIEVPIPKHNPSHQTGKYEKAKNLTEVKQVCADLKKKVAAVLGKGDIPLILHGDDSSVIGVGYGISSFLDEPFGVAYFDAHGDINTPETTLSGSLYGMGVAHMTGYGYKELLELNNHKAAVNAEDIILIGTRKLDPGEVEFIQKNKITKCSPMEIKDNIDKVLLEIKGKFESNLIRKLYLHFDQDIIDPAYGGATLCQEEGGLHPDEFIAIVKFLKKEFEIVGVSIGNYLPSIDNEEKTLNNIMDLLRTLGVINTRYKSSGDI